MYQNGPLLQLQAAFSCLTTAFGCAVLCCVAWRGAARRGAARRGVGLCCVNRPVFRRNAFTFFLYALYLFSEPSIPTPLSATSHSHTSPSAVRWGTLNLQQIANQTNTRTSVVQCTNKLNYRRLIVKFIQSYIICTLQTEKCISLKHCVNGTLFTLKISWN